MFSPLSMPSTNAKRFFKEDDDPSRSAFQRDRDRIIHCTAFRRLQYKTQVFVYDEGDHYRTRLTHSLEVSQIARSLAHSFAVAPDLVEALALAHDIGHPAFAHTGERGLKKMMRDFGGFDHNAQSFLILTEQETPYAEFDGLNLTYICLEGLLKHNGLKDIENKTFMDIIKHSPYIKKLDFIKQPCIEAQIAAISDDIAYCTHDLDDALRAGLFKIDELNKIEFLEKIIQIVKNKHTNIEPQRFRREFIRRIISFLINDVTSTSQNIISNNNITKHYEIENLKSPCVKFSDEMYANILLIKAFLSKNMYKAESVQNFMLHAEKMITALFELYYQQPDKLPIEWQHTNYGVDALFKARNICNFIAGMTDRFAIKEYKKFFDKKSI